jgi:hypothetical protein
LSCGVEEMQLGPRARISVAMLTRRWLIAEMAGIAAIFCRSRDDQAATNPAIAYALGAREMDAGTAHVAPPLLEDILAKSHALVVGKDCEGPLGDIAH